MTQYHTLSLLFTSLFLRFTRLGTVIWWGTSLSWSTSFKGYWNLKSAASTVETPVFVLTPSHSFLYPSPWKALCTLKLLVSKVISSIVLAFPHTDKFYSIKYVVLFVKVRFFCLADYCFLSIIIALHTFIADLARPSLSCIWQKSNGLTLSWLDTSNSWDENASGKLYINILKQTYVW